MDWIEKLFGISPDGGNGTAEVLFFAAAFAIAALIITYAQRGFTRRR